MNPRPIAIAIVALLLLGAHKPWPAIKPVEESFKIVGIDSVMRYVDIQSAANNHLICRVLCRDGDGEDPDFDYSGLLQ